MRNPRRLGAFLLGLGIFLVMYFLPQLPSVLDPEGHAIPLSHEAKAALGLFLMAGLWWVFEVFPVGVTAITIGVVQSLWFIRDHRTACSKTVAIGHTPFRFRHELWRIV